MADFLRGVNLGGWLVLEPWITPSLFKATEVLDEYTLYENADPETLRRLARHRQTFITQKDFAWLAQQGINAVRIPIGYWMFGDAPPYVGAIEYLDKAFRWAEKHHLHVVLSVHGAPGSQNGRDHSGRKGGVRWHTDPKHITATLALVQQLAERYKSSPQFFGIELLNEPSLKIPKRVLKRYYIAAYRLVRQICGDQPVVIYSDTKWRRMLPAPQYQNVWIDTHHYQAYKWRDKRRTVSKHLQKVTTKVSRAIARLQKYHPVIVGEWSAALDPQSLNGLSKTELDEAYRAYFNAQVQAYNQTAGWFYWTYKTEDGGPWSFRDVVKQGHMHVDIKAQN